MHIYLVEDDEIYNEFVNKSLSKEGYEVTSFYNAEDCLKALDSNKPSALIIDYKLPGMNGIELFQKIYPKIDEEKTKVIVLSSIDDGNMVLDFIKKGIRDYVVKDENVISSLVAVMEGQDDDYYFFDD